MSVRDLLISLLIMGIWGLNFPIAKMAIGEIPPLFLMALRFAFVAIILVPFVHLPKGKFKGIFLISLTFATIHFACLFTGLKDIDSSTASVILQFQVPISAILAAMIFKDRMHWPRYIGVILGIGGVAIIAKEPRFAGHYFSVGLILISACFWAISNVQLKSMKDLPILSLNGWVALFSVPQLLILSYFLENNQLEAIQNSSLKGYFAIFYMAIVSTILAYSLWYQILRKYDISRTIPFTLLIPIYGVVFSVFLLNEKPTSQMLLGSLVTMGGVAIILARRPKLLVKTPPQS